MIKKISAIISVIFLLILLIGCGGTTDKENCIHIFIGGTCTICGQIDENTPAYSMNNEKTEITFGLYPQSLVEDNAIKNSLSSKTGLLPTSTNNYDWTSYGYYISSSNDTNFMWYQDIILDNYKYRAVYFTSFRPYSIDFSTSSTYQDDNEYNTSTVYYFRFDPITWKVLELDEKNNEAFLFANIALDSQEYFYDYDLTRTITGKTVYANNYEYSTIRSWLNDNFYNTAFTIREQQIIIDSIVDNGASTTGSTPNQYACSYTMDNVFLLSYSDVENSEYGFTSNVTRQIKSTDYAKVQGCYKSKYNLENCVWWLRSPDVNNSNCVRGVNDDGNMDCSNVDYTNPGVVPALWITLDENIPTVEHVEGEWEIVKEATCIDTGIKQIKCTLCNKVLHTEVIDIIDHNYKNNICTICGKEKEITPLYSINEDKTEVTFGSYPQSLVTDDDVITSLDSEIGLLPTSTNNYDWTSYGYYISGTNETNFMWYQDITLDNNKYRAVYFTSYRPSWTDYYSFESYTYQDDNGYYTSTVYYFRFDPIIWKVLRLDKIHKKAFLFANIALDSQDYFYDYSLTRTIDGKTVYANNYEYSTIRNWLNDNFYNTAFTKDEQKIILNTLVDNSELSSGNTPNPYVCNDIKDKIFLLSASDVENSKYKLDSNEPRQIESSDYAKVQGCYTSTNTSYLRNCDWWMRSPNDSDAHSAQTIYYGGVARRSYVNSSYIGVIPALWITM